MDKRNDVTKKAIITAILVCLFILSICSDILASSNFNIKNKFDGPLYLCPLFKNVPNRYSRGYKFSSEVNHNRFTIEYFKPLSDTRMEGFVVNHGFLLEDDGKLVSWRKFSVLHLKCMDFFYLEWNLDSRLMTVFLWMVALILIFLILI